MSDLPVCMHVCISMVSTHCLRMEDGIQNLLLVLGHSVLMVYRHICRQNTRTCKIKMELERWLSS